MVEIKLRSPKLVTTSVSMVARVGMFPLDRLSAKN